jgi:hypothetical protein
LRYVAELALCVAELANSPRIGVLLGVQRSLSLLGHEASWSAVSSGILFYFLVAIFVCWVVDCFLRADDVSIDSAPLETLRTGRQICYFQGFIIF